MNTTERLQKIQKATGFSQQELAKKLGVSFATLNSWINERSTPHREKQQRVDDLFAFYVSGKEKIDPDDLLQKKNSLTTLNTKNKSIAQGIVKRKDLLEQLILSLTYNSNRIEGSTLSEADTAAVLFDDAVLPSKTFVEHMEVKNHETALRVIFRVCAKNNFNITEELILDLHEKLMANILEDAGQYRVHPVRIVGSYVPTANHVSIPQKMHALIEEMNEKAKDPITQLSQTHADFEQIHPFSDGNGRIGRLLMHIIALRHNLPPVFIEDTRKRIYYASLQKAQLEDDSHMLEDFVCDALKECFKILD